MEKNCTQKNHVYQQLVHLPLITFVLGALVDAPICIGVLLSLEGSQQAMVRSTQAQVRVRNLPMGGQKPVAIPAAVAPETPVAPANCDGSKPMEVPAGNTTAETVAPVAITPAAVTTAASLPEREESKKNPSAVELLDQAVKAVVAAKKASLEADFLAKLGEAKSLIRQIEALTKSKTSSEEYQAAKYLCSEIMALEEQHKAKKADREKQQEVFERLKKGEQQKKAQQPGDYEKSYQEFQAWRLKVEKKQTERVVGEEKERREQEERQKTLYDDVITEYRGPVVSEGQPPKHTKGQVVKARAQKGSKNQGDAREDTGQKTVPMMYSGSIKTGFCLDTGEYGLHQSLEGRLTVQAKLTDTLTFDGEGILGVRDLLNVIDSGTENLVVDIRRFSLSYESSTTAEFWVKAGKFESPLFKNPVGGNLLCLHPMGLFAGYGGSGTEGWLGPQFGPPSFVGGFSHDPRFGSIFVCEVSAHMREPEFMGVNCTFDLAVANICSLSHGGWLFNPKAAARFSLWEGMPAVASAELLIVLGEFEVQSGLRLGFRMGDVDEHGRPREIGGWMFQMVTTWQLPDACHTLSVSCSAIAGTRLFDWLTVSASGTFTLDDMEFQNRFAFMAVAQVTEELSASLTTEVAQATGSPVVASFQPGVRAEIQYEITDRLGLKKEAFFKTATVGANAFLSQEATGVGVVFEVGF